MADEDTKVLRNLDQPNSRNAGMVNRVILTSLRMASTIFQRLWDFEITPQIALRQRWVPAWAIVTMIGYVLL